MRRPTFLLRSALLLSTATALSFIIDDARAQTSSSTTSVEVPINADPPFDKWCLAPFCTSDPLRRASLLKAPAFIAPQPSDGLIAQGTKNALGDAAQRAVVATLGPAYNKAVADVAEAIAATLLTDRTRLEKAGGLGAAIVRGSLTYRIEPSIGVDSACTGARRFDAIYEGLGISVALRPLQFDAQGKARHSVAEGCVATAKATARAVDGTVLRTFISDEIRTQIEAVVRTVDDAKKSCADVPGASENALSQIKQAADVLRATTVDSIARALATYVATTPPALPPPTLSQVDPSAQPTVTSPAELACTKALAVLHEVKPAPLQKLAEQGLSNALLGPILDAMRTPSNEAFAVIARIANGAMSERDLESLVRSLIKSVVEAAGLPPDAPVLKDAIEALPKALLAAGESATLDPNVILAFLADKYGVDDDGKLSVRSLLGVVTPWIFELNGGLPNVDFSEQKIVGDVSIGYATKKFGIVGRGWLDTYNIDDALQHSDYLHTGGSLETWWLSGDGTGKLRLELRLAGALDYYDTTTYPFKDALSQFYDFDSRMGRGTGFVGIRYGAPNDRVSLQVLGGGGAQFEDPDTTKFTSGNNFSLTSQQNVTAQGAARLRVRVRIVPQIVGIRLRGDSTYFSITREQLLAVSKAGTLTTTSTVEQQQQIELHGRLFLDADVASFGGFVPAVFGGIDYIGTSGSATSTSTVIPLLGVGIVRQSW